MEYISTFDFRPSSNITPGLLATLDVQPNLMKRIRSRWREDEELVDIVDRTGRGESSSHSRHYALDSR